MIALLAARSTDVVAFKFCAERIGNETVLSKIALMVTEAQRAAKHQSSASSIRFRLFRSAVIFSAVVAFVAWALFDLLRWPHAPVVFISVLIIACPCALGLGNTDVDHGGYGSRRAAGILIRDVAALEKFEQSIPSSSTRPAR